MSAESALRLWVDKLSQFLQAYQHYPGKDLANDAEEKDAPVVVAVASVALVFIEVDYSGMVRLLPASTDRAARAVAAGVWSCNA